MRLWSGLLCDGDTGDTVSVGIGLAAVLGLLLGTAAIGCANASSFKFYQTMACHGCDDEHRRP